MREPLAGGQAPRGCTRADDRSDDLVEMEVRDGLIVESGGWRAAHAFGPEQTERPA